MVHFISEHTIFPIIKKLFRIKVTGLENISKDKNYIFAMNHRGLLDVPLAQAIITGYTLCTLIWENLFFFPLNFELNSWNSIKVPVDKKKRKNCLFEAKKMLDKSYDVLIFPEGGERFATGLIEIPRAHTGAVRIALMSGKTIIPVGCKGSFEAWKFRRDKFYSFMTLARVKPLSLIELNIGREFKIKSSLNIENETKALHDFFRRNTTKLLVNISELAEEKYSHDLNLLR